MTTETDNYWRNAYRAEQEAHDKTRRELWRRWDTTIVVIFTLLGVFVGLGIGVLLGRATDADGPAVSLDRADHAVLVGRMVERFPGEPANPTRWVPWWGAQVCVAGSGVYAADDAAEWLAERDEVWRVPDGFAEQLRAESLDVLCPGVTWP